MASFFPPTGGASNTPGDVVVALADTQNLDVTGVDGESMGGVEISGCIQTPTISGGGGLNAHYFIMPNAITPANGVAVTQGDFSSTIGLAFGIAPTGASRIINFTIRCLDTRTGRGPRLFELKSSDSNLAGWRNLGRWLDDSTPITSFRIMGRYTDGTQLGALSIVSQISGGYSGKSFIDWKALGRP